MPPILLLTRPLDQSLRFAGQAERALPAHRVLIAPLTEVAPIPVDPAVFADAAGVLLTSANAVPTLPPLPGLPAWCVGAATARAAQLAGLQPLDGGGDAAAMIALLRAHRPEGRLVYARGAEVAHDLSAALPGLRIDSVIAYDARPCAPSPAALAALAGAEPVIASLFSPRAARLFSALPGAGRARIVAISPACAAALPGGFTARLANSPDAGGMLRALAEEMSQAPRTG